MLHGRRRNAVAFGNRGSLLNLAEGLDLLLHAVFKLLVINVRFQAKSLLQNDALHLLKPSRGAPVARVLDDVILNYFAELFDFVALHLDLLLECHLKVFLELRNSLIQNLAQVVERALPVFALIGVLLDLGLDDEDVVLEVLHIVLLPGEDVVVLAHDAQLGLEGVLGFPLDDELKRIAHDRDEHVEEDDLGDERCEEEEHVAEQFVRVRIKAALLERAQA